MNTAISKNSFSTGDIGKIITIAIALITVYFPIFTRLVDNWAHDDNYSHGFFIPAISLYMIYCIRHEFHDIKIQPSNWGIPVLLLGLIQLLIGKIGSEFFLQRTSLIPVLIGLILFLLGSGYLKKMFFPIIFLIFMVPLPAVIWSKIAFPMQLFASNLTEQVILLIGIPILREGNILYLAETTLEVVDACSGLRSLLTLFALSATFAWFVDLTRYRKCFLFLCAAPVAIFANIIRLTGTALLAHYFGERAAQGFLHEISGFITFFIGLFLLGIIYWLLQSKRKHDCE